MRDYVGFFLTNDGAYIKFMLFSFSASVFSKVSQISVNLENQGEKFKQEFSKYIVSVVNAMNNK